jgi:hypothetical protein
MLEFFRCTRIVMLNEIEFTIFAVGFICVLPPFWLEGYPFLKDDSSSWEKKADWAF